MENSLQRTDDWYEMRRGRFTGSQIHRLLGVKGLGKTGETYAFENAVEIVFGKNEEEQFESFDTQRGNTLEPFAFNKFSELKEMEFMDVQKCSFFPFGENAGASPDGIVNKDAVLEIKAPRANKFFRLVAGGVDEIDSEYIAQMQMEMLCTNSVRCHFFNYIIYNGEPMWHEIVIERDEVMIDLIKKRIDEAVIIRDNFIEQLRSKKQF